MIRISRLRALASPGLSPLFGGRDIERDVTKYIPLSQLLFRREPVVQAGADVHWAMVKLTHILHWGA